MTNRIIYSIIKYHVFLININTNKYFYAYNKISREIFASRVVVEKHWVGKQFVRSIYHPSPRELLYATNVTNVQTDRVMIKNYTSRRFEVEEGWIAVVPTIPSRLSWLTRASSRLSFESVEWAGRREV